MNSVIERFRIELSWLASLEYQRRMIVHATKDEYILADELFDRALSAVENVVKVSGVWPPPCAQERAALEEFLRVVNTLPKGFTGRCGNAEELIERNTSWIAARKAALTCLNTLNVPIDLDELLAA